jgi:hypothetical protein
VTPAPSSGQRAERRYAQLEQADREGRFCCGVTGSRRGGQEAEPDPLSAEGACRIAVTRLRQTPSPMNVRDVLRQLEWLVAARAITGYTVEPDPRYLDGDVPALTYSMPSNRPVSRQNLRLLAEELAGAGATVELAGRHGTWLWDGRVRRTLETTAIARFARERDLQRALARITARYVAGAPGAVPGSWTLPDVRVCGARTPGMVAVGAHSLPLASTTTAVVIAAADRPPLPGMRTLPVGVLPAWADYLGIRA